MELGRGLLTYVVRDTIVDVLVTHKWNRTHASRSLGIGIRTLQRKLKRYGLSQVFSNEQYDALVSPQSSSLEKGV